MKASDRRLPCSMNCITRSTTGFLLAIEGRASSGRDRNRESSGRDRNRERSLLRSTADADRVCPGTDKDRDQHDREGSSRTRLGSGSGTGGLGSDAYCNLPQLRYAAKVICQNASLKEFAFNVQYGTVR